MDIFKKSFLNLNRFYFNLSIRLKYSIFIGFILLLLILSLSFSVIEAEKYVLREMAEEKCEMALQSLSGVAKDNLLTNNFVSIQDVINNMKRLNLEGFEYAFVIDRDGKFVAHSDELQITNIDSFYFAKLRSSNLSRVFNSKHKIEYLQLLTQVRQDQNGNIQNIVIGLAGVGFSQSIISHAFDRARLIIYLITVGIIMISIFLVHLLSRQLSRNIVTLSDGVRDISAGNLDIEIKVNSQDEIGMLAGEFNKMVKSLRENLQMQKFVSKLTVDMIQNQTNGIPKSTAIQTKKIAVLFSDIRGFTKLSEELDPEELVKIINVYLNIQTKVIEKNGGVVDKFAGDQVMALFQNDNAADASIISAIAIQKEITEINISRRKNNEEYLTIGIGINYGYAMIGSMGTSSRMDYTAIGDVVNLASKLCNYARASHIVVTKNVIKNLNGAFSIIKMEPVVLSGRKKTEEIYRVVYK